MNKYVLSSVCAFAATALQTSFASTTDPALVEPPNYHVGYFQQDADSDLQTDSDSEGNYDIFYDRLAPDGQWLNDDQYGYVWQPNVAVSTTSWRPYSDGHWVWTDRGWFWQSNENFGWATYHYGRWVLIDGSGWVWVPGRHWAPAWVSWRHTDNDDYVGWAPLPPESSFSTSVGIHPWCDTYYDIGPAAFAFIRIGDFGRPSYRESYLPQQQNLGFFSRTTNITNITYNNNVINNYGPDYQRVSQAVQQQGGQQLPSYKINYAAQNQANAAFKTSAQGNQLNVLAPPQTLKPTATVQPQVAKELGKTQVDRGWRNVPDTQAKQLRQQYVQQTPVPQNLPAKPAPPAKPQIQAATKSELHPPNEPAKGPPAPGGQLKPFVEKPGNSGPAEQKKPGAENAKPVQPVHPIQPENAKPAEKGPAPGSQSKPFVEKPGNNGPAEQKKPETENAKPVQPVHPTQPENAKPAEKGPAPDSQLKPFIEKPGNTAPAAEQRKPETEKAKPVRPVEPENARPVEPPKQPTVNTEEKKAGPPVVPTEKTQTKVEKSEGEHVQPKPEVKRPAENEKPGGHEGAPQHKKEEPKKEPTPQAKASHQKEQHRDSAPRLT
jgi:hypothetical protein